MSVFFMCVFCVIEFDFLCNRLGSFDTKNWRFSYKALIVLEYLLTHGPKSVAEEFQSDKDVICKMGSFHYIDEKGFNWGLNVRKKSERILKLLEKGSVLKQERDKARKLSRGIEGFGSYSERSFSAQRILTESERLGYGRCHSESTSQRTQDDWFSFSKDEGPSESEHEISQQTHLENVNLVSIKKMENSNSMGGFSDDEVLEKFGARISSNKPWP
ncbi:clathrin interactor EPSIN 1-like [Cornus florida]|uniref:clathrin interactor EPSIN 1-like n=1 Tax=Cornus florida TaxID=4283 RepID=UPI0028A25897|nr:clathrin interactor EPSIN 1-like [Cornus florida]